MTLASLCGLVLFVGYISPGKLASKRMKHYHTTARSSAMVIHNGTVYLSGQVGKVRWGWVILFRFLQPPWYFLDEVVHGLGIVHDVLKVGA